MITVESSEHYRFTRDQVTYRAHIEVDGKPWLTEPMELMPDGTVTVSPFVSLDVP